MSENEWPPTTTGGHCSLCNAGKGRCVMSICYESVTEWTEIYNVIVNRISIINQQLGYGVDGLVCNPVRLVSSFGNYSVLVAGVEYANFGVYDLLSTGNALSRLDGLKDGLWYLMRKSIISKPTN